MRKMKFRALNRDSKVWIYAENDYEWKDFFYGIEDGQLDIDTLGRYIGLNDKNRKEIYEGDIVKWGFGWTGEIRFHTAGYWIFVSGQRHTCLSEYRGLHKIEIIGNIHTQKKKVKK